MDLTPKKGSAVTDENGQASIRIDKCQSADVHILPEGALKANADGYLKDSLLVSANGRFSDGSIPQKWNSKYAKFLPGGSTATIRLYREPKATVAFIVPNGYQGIVTVHFKPSSTFVTGGIGQREFTFHATEKGRVVVNATPLLFDSIPEVKKVCSRVFYADGSPVPKVTKDGFGVGFVARSYDKDGYRLILFIGTNAEYMNVWWPLQGEAFNRPAFDKHFSIAD